jgi:hypothetical protein
MADPLPDLEGLSPVFRCLTQEYFRHSASWLDSLQTGIKKKDKSGLLWTSVWTYDNAGFLSPRKLLILLLSRAGLEPATVCLKGKDKIKVKQGHDIEYKEDTGTTRYDPLFA